MLMRLLDDRRGETNRILSTVDDGTSCIVGVKVNRNLSGAKVQLFFMLFCICRNLDHHF